MLKMSYFFHYEERKQRSKQVNQKTKKNNTQTNKVKDVNLSTW